MSLSRVLAVFVFALVGLTLAASASLILVTSYLHRSATDLVDSVESLRVAEGAKSDLLLLARARDELVRSELAVALRRKLSRARDHLGSAHEALLLERAQSSVEAFLSVEAGAAREAEHDRLVGDAVAAIGALVDLNHEQARLAGTRATRWDRLGDLLGWSIALLLLAGSVGMLWWLRSFAFRPLLAIAHAMTSYGNGDRTARVQASGPLEVRLIGARFNELADSLERHRDAELSLLAGVVHDLRNPLTPLRMSLGLIRADRPLPPEERVRHLLGVIGRQVTRLDRMVSDLLDTARMQAGRLPIRAEPCDARDVLRETVDLFRAGSAGRSIALHMPSEPVRLVCDATRVAQVLTNLLSNAIKYSEPDAFAQVTLLATDDEVVYAVTDHGPGISPEDQRRLFEPFRRAQHTRDTAAGAGLGLFVVRAIAEAHGGRIVVNSALGRGSTFELRLPRAGHDDDAGNPSQARAPRAAAARVRHLGPA